MPLPELPAVIELPYKQKRTAQQLINEVFKENGVKFQLISEEEAIPYLEDRNYYYKLACYRKNFRKDKRGKYIYLDFFHLLSISKIDRDLRYMLLQMTLEIEHFLKVMLLKHISYNDQVDGYAIVNDFISSYNAKNGPDRTISVDSLIKKGKSHSSVSHGIYQKVSSNGEYIAIWQLFEVLHMNELECFFSYYFTRFPSLDINVKAYESLLISSRYVRNAAAHNNPLLINLSSLPPNTFGSKGGFSKHIINRLLLPHFEDQTAGIHKAIQPTYRFRDIAAVLKLYKLLRIAPVSSPDSLVESLQALLEKVNNDPPYPIKNNDMRVFFLNLSRLFWAIYK